MKKLLYLLCFALSLAFVSCGHDDPEPTPSRMRRTVIVYMAAENSLSRFTSSDINEMIEAAGTVPLDCNFVVYLDNASDETQVFTISAQGGQALHKNLTERNSCDPDVFKSTMQEILTDFPADTYSLVMWSHGSGWIPTPKRTIGIDNNRNNYQNLGSELEIPEMRKALESLGVHWDYIFFDACFMQCVETGYELRNVADYVIGSPAEIPGNGAPYGTIMPELTGTTNDASILSLVEKYYNAYASEDGLVISAVKTKELPQLLNVTKSLVPDYYTKAYSLPTEGIQMYCPYHFMASNKPEYFDMASTMNQMLSTDSYAQWEKQMHQTVFVRRFSDKWYSIYESYFSSRITDPTHIAALSIFIPNQKYDEEATYNEYIKEMQWYQDFVK